jgi:predicted nucleic acid-binding protein
VTAYCLDTSALAKRYARETGTAWILSPTDPASGHDLYSVRLTGPEVVATLFRKARGGQITLAQARHATANFRVDWQHQYQIVEVTPCVAERAMALAEQYGLRGYDAVHVAAALELQDLRRALHLPALTFVTADEEQLQAATAEGLLTANPHTYP